MTTTVMAHRPGDPTLDLDDIQGDVLIGLQKRVERFVFFEIAERQVFRSLLRDPIAGWVTTTRVVAERERRLAESRAPHPREELPGLNVAFTAAGLDKVYPGHDLGDASFAAGAVERAASLGDPIERGIPARWREPYRSGRLDGVFFFTGGTRAVVDQQVERVFERLGGAVRVTGDEIGEVRPGAEAGHEHFGWLDGVSQPGIRGLTEPLPGQRLIDPWRFLFGPGRTERQRWARNGSFLVFRRLNQLVPELARYLSEEGGRLGMSAELLGARLVGRWKSGAPLELAPLHDDPALGADPRRNNAFDFATDPEQRRCPFGAHVRKVNPRADVGPRFSQEEFVDPARILRAGIPFGPEVEPDEAAAHRTRRERGLLFVCYQRSIAEQFERVQAQWANQPGFIFGKRHPDGSAVEVGWDPIIGQNAAPGWKRARTMDEPVPNFPTGNVRSTLLEPHDFVVPTGGAYFFVPSLTALRETLGG